MPGGREKIRDGLLRDDRGMSVRRGLHTSVVVLRHLQRVELRVDVVRRDGKLDSVFASVPAQKQGRARSLSPATAVILTPSISN